MNLAAKIPVRCAKRAGQTRPTSAGTPTRTLGIQRSDRCPGGLGQGGQGRILVSHDKRDAARGLRSSFIEAVRVLVSCWSFHWTHRSVKLLKP